MYWMPSTISGSTTSRVTSRDLPRHWCRNRESSGPLCVGDRRRVHRATMSPDTTKSTMMTVGSRWVGDLVITDPIRSRFSEAQACHIGFSDTLWRSRWNRPQPIMGRHEPESQSGFACWSCWAGNASVTALSPRRPVLIVGRGRLLVRAVDGAIRRATVRADGAGQQVACSGPATSSAVARVGR